MRLPSLFGARAVRKVRGAGENVDRPISFFGNSLESLPGTQEASCSDSTALLPVLSNRRI